MRLGADPEVFLLDPKTGKHLSVIGRIGGDKYNPVQIKGLRKGFTLQEDNVALEFGIPPAATEDEWVASIEQVMRQGLKKTECLFSRLSATVFAPDQMKHPAAHVFGCEPDFDAWTGTENVKPHPENEFMRSAGGHIHVETDKDPMQVVKYMDLYLGVPSCLMDTVGAERRKLYGKRGACRPKPYGVEYRTLSNFWIFEDKYRRWAWQQTARALESDLAIDNLRDPIEEAINNGNLNVARELLQEFKLVAV